MRSDSMAACNGSRFGFLLATVALPALAAAADAERDNTIPEIIVTAEKRTERLQDVPIPITAITAGSLVESNQVRIQDFYTKFPGLDVNVTQQSQIQLQVRGLSGAVTIDDVPISVTSFLEQAGGLGLDLDPSGLAQVELLRGPQGTLYGANSEGGLLRYVTADPKTDRISGRLEAGASGVYHGNDPGWSFRGSVNLPVNGDVAVLMDGFARQDPGYIDNPVLGIDGINRSHTYGGHAGLLWHPTDALSVKLSAFFQRSRGNGTNDDTVGPGLGPYQQNYIAGVGPYQRQSQLYSATVKYQLGGIELTSVSGYVWTGFHDTFDGTTRGLAPYGQFGIPGTDFTGFGQPGMLVPESAHSSSFTQEFRLATKIGELVDVLFGGFYNFAYGEFGEEFLSSNPTTGAVAGSLDFVSFAAAARSYAAFANLNFHLTDQLSVQLGGRQEYDHAYNYGLAFTGPGNPIFGIPTTERTILPSPSGDSQKFTFLVTPQYKFSPNLMVYARVASGYAPGAPNPAGAGVPPMSKPDTVIDYEVGTKINLLNNRWSIDASAYHIKHDDIQQGLFSEEAQFYYTGNAGSARSDGLELSSEIRPAPGLRVSSWIAWNESKITGLPPSSALGAYQGQPLPFSPKWSGNVSLDQEFPLGAYTGFAGLSVTYLGSRWDSFTGTGADRLVFPAYTKADLHVGMNYQDWTARLYANNVTNRRGLINGGPSTLIPNSFYYITPRTIGLQVSRNF
ncbi:MAG: TonB-dependent receptor [Proteobacteria bacterium]|nr:TonB-dependent receptor [Pseudomonadota bacterium]